MNKLAALLSIALLTACTSSAEPKPDPKPDEPVAPAAPTQAEVLATWQGAWEMKFIEGADAEPIMADASFAENKLSATMRGDDKTAVFRVLLDPALTPATIDMSAPNDDGGMMIKGLYTLQTADGVEHLTLCFPKRETDPRPEAPLPCNAADLVRIELTRPAKQ
jgi:uncharacterized protein (TIGR03067 family)